jgi:hypothetical protein
MDARAVPRKKLERSSDQPLSRARQTLQRLSLMMGRLRVVVPSSCLLELVASGTSEDDRKVISLVGH